MWIDEESNEEFIADVKSLIKSERGDTFINHLRTILISDLYNYTGSLRKNKVKIWRYTRVIGWFYPVAQIDLPCEKNYFKCNISVKPNKVGLLLWIIIISGFIWITFSALFETNLEWTYVWKRAILGILFLSIPIGISILSFNFEKRKMIKELTRHLPSLDE